MLGFSKVKGILAGLGGSFVALTLFFLRWPLSGIELALYDRNFQWFWAEPSAPSEIVIVSIDSPSLDALGPFPWPRAHHAAVIREVAGDGAKAIGVDIGFFEPDRYDPVNDQRLIQATADAGNVVYPMVFEVPPVGGDRRLLLGIQRIRLLARDRADTPCLVAQLRRLIGHR
jgi:CHASE2 domain-containing sensor protein